MGPLSPLIFWVVEEVLSRGIPNLVYTNHLQLIKGIVHHQIHSHSLYAYDIMLFRTASPSNTQNLSNFFARYAETFGKFINPNKYIIYGGFTSQTIMNHISSSLDFNIDYLPLLYLGVLIFKGRPIKLYFQLIIEKDKINFDS